MKTILTNDKIPEKSWEDILAKVLISQLVLALGFLTWYRIQDKIIVLNMVSRLLP